MREKYTETAADRKFMNSIGKNMNKKYTRKNPFAESYRAKNEKLHPSAKSKAIVSKIGKGRSHISGNIYSHE